MPEQDIELPLPPIILSNLVIRLSGPSPAEGLLHIGFEGARWSLSVAIGSLKAGSLSDDLAEGGFRS